MQQSMEQPAPTACRPVHGGAHRRPPRSAGRVALQWALVVSLGAHLNLALILALLPAPPRPPARSPALELELAPVPARAPAAVRIPPMTPPTLPRPRLTPRAAQPAPRPLVAQAAPPPRPEPAPKVPPPSPPPERARPPALTMVELDAAPSERAPERARFLSDANRRVEQETRAKQTTLEAGDEPRPAELALAAPPAPRSPPTPPATRPGRPDASDDQTHRAPRARLPAPRVARAPAPRAPLLTMRSTPPAATDPARLGALHPGGLAPRVTPARELAPALARRAGRLRAEDPLALDHRDYDRVFGAGAAHERELALRTPSVARGGVVQGRWNRLRAALENFTPDVRPGNQTALNTRADPFALYIARMHRRIHTRWGFDYLGSLDQKPRQHPLNDMTLQTTIEIAVAPQGDVAKATIVRPSGQLVFDTAALDTVFSAGPYPPTPVAIRSANGQVYMHWSFHRDERQCGTFGVQPFILTQPGDGLRDGRGTPAQGQSAVDGDRAGWLAVVERIRR